MSNNPDFWELPTDSSFLENLPSSRSLWHETPEGRAIRLVFGQLFDRLKPVVLPLIKKRLTKKQYEIVRLYYFAGKTQEEIATILGIRQSTVSRHLFGTTRKGRKVGGALPKLRRIIEQNKKVSAIISAHQETLRTLHRSA